MFYKALVCSMFCLLIFTQCSNPKKAEIPQDISSWESNSTFKKSVDKLKDDDKKQLLAYLVRTQMSAAFGGEGMKKGTTIEDAIKFQKEWQDEQSKEEQKQKLLAAELQKKQLESIKKMNDVLTVTLLNLSLNSKDYERQIYSDYFSIKVGFKNNSEKDISGVKGTVILKDMFGSLIKNIGISNDNGIKANGTSTYSGTMDFNQFEDSDKKLASTEFSKIKFEWNPDVYIFADGSTIEMPK
jgi:hypothetical protein